MSHVIRVVKGSLKQLTTDEDFLDEVNVLLDAWLKDQKLSFVSMTEANSCLIFVLKKVS